MADGSYDAIVVGLGAMGAAACDHLARRGLRVLGLEQFDIPHELGSSHGSSRVIRLAYFEDPRYVPLARRSFDLWRDLERRAGEPLLVMTGGLDIAPRDSTELRNVTEGLTRNRLAFERLDAAEVRRRFPALQIPADHAAIWQADTGVLNPERGIVGHVESAMAAGAECHARETVAGWTADGNGVTVATDRGRYTARRLVLTVGPWTAGLLADLGAALWVERQVQCWFQPQSPADFSVGRLPVFVHHMADGVWYGIPIQGRPGVKVSRHHGGARVSATEIDRTPTRADEADVRRYIRRCLPGADGPVMAMKVCMYTNSPDGHFIIDRHPQHPNVLLACGFSGHGYKFAPVVGEVLANLATDQAVDPAMALFSLSRLSVNWK